METVLLCIINLLSFVIGAKVGIKISRGLDININPIKAVSENIKQNNIKKTEDLDKRKMDTILENLDNYNGTGFGQNEIPKE
jgi:hypothetical protein